MEEELIRLKNWLQEGKKTAIAIVVKKKGSALRQTGAKMIVSEQGEIFGSVSGGCVESAVAEEALNCMRSGKTSLLHYGITDDTAWSVGLMCGGEVDVFVQPVMPDAENGINSAVIHGLIALQQTRVPYAFLVFMDGKLAGRTCIAASRNGELESADAIWADEELQDRVHRLLKKESSQVVETPNGNVFVDIYKPSPRLVIIGAAHVSMALAPLAKKLDYMTIVIDPRTAFATPERFPAVDEMITIWPVEAMEKIGLNREDYVLLLSHDDKLDLPAAGRALETGVKYIGMLSSRTTRERRFGLLKDEGYSIRAIEKIHAPIGLNIGSRSPEEIALSIIAEITAFRYGKVE